MAGLRAWTTRPPLGRMATPAFPNLTTMSPPDPPPSASQCLNALIRLFQAGEHRRAASEAQQFMAVHPREPMLAVLLGAAQAALGEAKAAEAAFDRALAIDPDCIDAHYNRALLLQGQGAAAAAEAGYERVIALAPGHAGAWNNLAVLRLDGGRPEAGLVACDALLRIAPDYRDGHVNRGNALTELARHAEAVEAYDRALAIDPRCSEAHANRGNALQELGQLEAALAAFDAALACNPANDTALLRKLHIEARLCIWDGLRRFAPRLPMLGVTGEAVHPLGMLAIEDAPERHRLRAERFVAARWGALAAGAAPAPIQDPPGSRRLRIGYISADFKVHPVAQLIAGVLAAHDRTRFEVHAFALTAAPGDAMRARIAASMEHFTDISGLSDAEAAAQIRAAGLDLAIDLTGHTRQSRTGILARRVAPVQVAFLGYAGTMGAPFIDYLVADAQVIPAEARAQYCERLLMLPGSVLPHDDTLPIATRQMTRRAFGLPEQGFVFAAFNAPYKITPAEWDVWMGLLAALPGSVLWLADPGATARANLAREAAARGVAPERLVWAERTLHDEHLARHRLADLFLDTFAYNAHTTAVDALWAGLPILTLAGRSFAARIAGSLLHALGLPELVTTTREDYAALAQALAGDPQRLAGLRARLAEACRTGPQFDTRRYTRSLEQGLAAAIERNAAGLAPEDIVIAPDA